MTTAVSAPIRWKDVPKDDDLRLDLRYRAKTDLVFLGHDVLGYPDLNREDHGEIADFFVKKDPFRTVKEQISEFRIRMLILPRRTFKTTWNIVDTVQWVIVDSEVAVMVMTASNSEDAPLADLFVQETASHFYHNPEAPLSRFHMLFPEHMIEKYPKAGVFWTPARKKYRRDPTVKAVSIEQSLSGLHPDIIKSEDVQDNRNSQTAAALRKVRKNFYINLKMLPEWGFVDLTATRYGPNDLYSHMLLNRGPRTTLLWKPAYFREPWVPKDTDDDDLREEDVVLQFPKQLSWAYLREVKQEDPESYWTQYMNVAEGNFVPTFPSDMLEKRRTPEADLPYHGAVHIAWRFEYGDTKNAAAAVGLLFGGRLHVVDVLRGTYKPTHLARKVVELAQKWECHAIEIEDTPGARDYENAIHNESLEQRWQVSIAWQEFVRDACVSHSKIRAVEPHLEAGRLLFADNLANWKETFRQLYQYGIIEDTEIPRVVAQLTTHLPPSIASDEFSEDSEDAWDKLLRESAYERIFGPDTEPEAPIEEVAEEEPDYEPVENLYALSEMMPGLSG